jgi:diacylglycerol kinase
MKLLKSFSYAFKGLAVAIREQRNLKIHLAVAVVVIVFAYWVEVTMLEWCVLLIMIGLVLAAELLNTAIENLVDLVTKDHHPLAGKVKDIAAAAVLVISGISVIVGFIIFAPYVSEKLLG